MKILHLAAGNLFGGVETALLEFARARRFVPELQQEFAVCFDGRLSAELKACEVAVHTLGAMRASRPWTVWKARRAFRQVLVARKFDAIVMHSGWCHALLGSVARRVGTRIVLWGHADFTGQSWEDRRTLRHPPNWVAANSRHTAHSFAQRLPGVPCEVLYLPLSAPAIVNPEREREAVRAELNLPPGTVAILQASRLEEWKGQSVLLEALSQLTTSAPWIALVAGGPQRPAEEDFFRRLNARTAELKLADRVRFLGQRRDVPSLLNATDIFCQANTGPEPFGLVFVEALYAGRPVITSAFGGALEIVDDTCGLLTPPGDVRALTEALRELIDAPARRQQLAGKGPARARELCDPEKCFRTLWNTLKGWLAE